MTFGMRMNKSQRVFLAVVVVCAAVSGLGLTAQAEDSPTDAFQLIVMDPLAAPLACDCVEGYAQRKYEKLGEYLAPFIGRPVNVVFVNAIGTALEEKSTGRADLVIGKHSVVASDAKKNDLSLTPVAHLTGPDGKTTQTGLIVVLADDPAQTAADLAGYRIFFGPADCDEKSAAPMKLLRESGVELPEDVETCPACSDAAVKILELGPEVRSAAVISSYAKPLLEGCGTVKKGDLRVVGESDKVPFITAFVNEDLSASEREKVMAGLNEVQYDIQMLIALESKVGFVPVDRADDEPDVAKKKN
ncbi:MAG: hypothetical protein DWQ34_00700 [Planctomycetota bacterium]|nr:MAG: hypothetical protein DWQ29_07960 [Planctomycetota bacterium]REJ97890.1 MAG: hypothetical protein DWQ34_00700 [Planctomycetota bacterium]REK25638.1 MAG: hypothetical protein DWQ41_11950 [Planctomycetota bacterium]REK31650.1 MAG: hypothetical protein DWQ45_18735 [Planctomycetota bacterium]